MRVHGLDVAVDRRDVIVRDRDVIAATARWTGTSLELRTGSLSDEVRRAIESAIVADEQQAIATSEATSHDDDGVDLTLIDWMLSLSPAERLRVLMRHASELSAFVRDDLRE
jgi:hypothetical protein